jgi:hypothetical protein
MAQEAWGKTALISITPVGTSDIDFTANVDSIDVKFGRRSVVFHPTKKGGRLADVRPMEDTIVTFEGYFVGIDPSSGDDLGISQHFLSPGSTRDNSDPMSITSVNKDGKYRVSILYTDDTTATSATGTTALNAYAERITLADGFIEEYEESDTDFLKKATFSFRFPAFDSAASSCIKQESTKTTGLSALAAYTTSVKW